MTALPRHLARLLVAVTCCQAASAAPARAQQDVMRDAYGFHGSSLEVDVATEAAGRIQLIRGQRSRIEVAGRAPNGFTSASLGGHGVRRLTLTSLGADRVDFVVVVPEDVRVRVRWPGSARSELFGTLSDAVTYAWSSTSGRPAFESLRPDAAEPLESRPSTAGSTAAVPVTATPRALDIIGAYRLERLTLRIEGEDFRVSSPRSVQSERIADRLRLIAPDNGDVSIFVPAGEPLTLSLDGEPAIVLDGDDVRVLCEAVLSQVLPDGRRWLTLTPVPRGGCAPAREPAHRATPAGHRRT